jgi:hypothetical protein
MLVSELKRWIHGVDFHGSTEEFFPDWYSILGELVVFSEFPFEDFSRIDDFNVVWRVCPFDGLPFC